MQQSNSAQTTTTAGSASNERTPPAIATTLRQDLTAAAAGALIGLFIEVSTRYLDKHLLPRVHISGKFATALALVFQIVATVTVFVLAYAWKPMYKHSLAGQLFQSFLFAFQPSLFLNVIRLLSPQESSKLFPEVTRRKADTPTTTTTTTTPASTNNASIPNSDEKNNANSNTDTAATIETT
jgi:hypothetical protein